MKQEEVETLACHFQKGVSLECINNKRFKSQFVVYVYVACNGKVTRFKEYPQFRVKELSIVEENEFEEIEKTVIAEVITRAVQSRKVVTKKLQVIHTIVEGDDIHYVLRYKVNIEEYHYGLGWEVKEEIFSNCQRAYQAYLVKIE